MSGTLHVWPEEWRREDGRVVVAAALEWPDDTRETLWYRVPGEHEDTLTRGLDPFAVALVMVAMRRGTDVRLHGTVSPTLLANLEEYRTIWRFWRPAEYEAVDFSADEETEAARPAGGAIAGFSGGVDSCYTVYRHVRGQAGRNNLEIAAGLQVEGFDIPVDDPTSPAAAKRAARILGSVGVPLVTAATNWRELEQRHRLDWTHSFGSAMISALSLFAGGYSTGVLASGPRYYDVKPHGSTPLTDPLLGSAAFPVRHDGADADRIEKMALISAWPEALRDLRVCWEGEDRSRNCCECEKCIRTLLMFRVLGVERPPCFDRDVTIDQIRRLTVWFVPQLKELDSIVEHAERAGMRDEPWVRALRRRIAAIRRNPDDEPLGVRLMRRARRAASRLRPS